MSKKYVIVDCNNLLHRIFHMNSGDPEDVIIEHCHFQALQTMFKNFSQHKGGILVATFDGEKAWRKLYTKDLSQCVTHKKYKGLRKDDMTPKEKRLREKFDEHLEKFIDVLKEHTKALVLHHKFLEADDLIAGWVQHHPDDEHIIVSTDKDFMQLINENVTLITPDTGKPRTLEDFYGSAEFFIFQKCFRGESGKSSDNVQSAYPFIRKTKLLEAFKDELVRTNVMQHQFEVEELNENDELIKYKYITKDLFEENQILMDLTKQPDHIKDIIKQTIDDEKERPKKFNKWKFLRYCNQMGMDRIVENGDYMFKMLSNPRLKD